MIKSSKSIRILDPYGGWININDSAKDGNLDTGFGNRLLYWLSAYNLNKLSDFQFKLFVEEPWWPELKIIDLPNTEIFKYKFNPFQELHEQWSREQKKYLYDDEKMCGLITDLKYNQIINNNHVLLEKDNWITYYRYKSNGEVFPSIVFKNKIFDNYIKEKISNTIGVHYRRGNGIALPIINKVFKDENGNSGITKKEDLKIVKWKKENLSDINDTPFIPNDYYFKIIDEKIKISPNTKVYLSYDVPKEFIYEFQVKYKKRLLTHDDFINTVKIELEKDKIYFNDWPYDNVIRTMIDFYVLLNTEYFIEHPFSSWSHIINISKNQNKIL